MGCNEELSSVDDDPNGDWTIMCARCQAEEEHDYDVEPGVVFDRHGRRVVNAPIYHAMPDALRTVFDSIVQQPQRQDSVTDQLKDLQLFANRLGLYDAADAIKNLLDKP
jgi:hypothetical protein